MTVQYCVQIAKTEKGLFEAKEPTKPQAMPAEFPPFDPEGFGVGYYAVKGAKKLMPGKPMSLDELRKWFDDLDGSLGKEPGKKGPTEYRVCRIE